MNIPLVIVLALALAMDAFTVALGMSAWLEKITAGQTIRLAAFFGVFQFMMPTLGWFAGGRILAFIQQVDHWVAFGLLCLIGLRMILASFRTGETNLRPEYDPTTGLSLLLLSVATSLDALAAGLGLGALRVDILFPAAVIGLVAFLMTVVGIKIGRRLGEAVGKRAELLGGMVLILIGAKILIDHLT